MASLYTSRALCLPKNFILELDLWESNTVFPSFMQVMACFVFLCEPRTLPGLFQRTILLGARRVLPVLTARKLYLPRGPGQPVRRPRHPSESGYLCNPLRKWTPSRLSTGKGKKHGQGSNPEVETLPSPPILCTQDPPRSPPTTASPARTQTQGPGGAPRPPRLQRRHC